MGNVMSIGRRWGIGEIVVGIDAVLRYAKPGDIILFKGRGIDGCCIRFMSINEDWSHIGIVVREFPSDPSSRLLIVEAYPTVIGPDVYRGGARHRGVQVVDLEDRLHNYMGHLAWRPVNMTRKHPNFVKHQENFKKFLGNLPRPIEYVHFDFHGIKRIVEIGTASISDHDNRNMEVCNTMAAHTLWALGVIKTDELYKLDNLTLACFGSTYAQLPVRPGWQIGDIHRIIRDWRFDEI